MRVEVQERLAAMAGRVAEELRGIRGVDADVVRTAIRYQVNYPVERRDMQYTIDKTLELLAAYDQRDSGAFI